MQIIEIERKAAVEHLEFGSLHWAMSGLDETSRTLLDKLFPVNEDGEYVINANTLRLAQINKGLLSTRTTDGEREDGAEATSREKSAQREIAELLATCLEIIGRSRLVHKCPSATQQIGSLYAYFAGMQNSEHQSMDSMEHHGHEARPHR